MGYKDRNLANLIAEYDRRYLNKGQNEATFSNSEMEQIKELADEWSVIRSALYGSSQGNGNELEGDLWDCIDLALRAGFTAGFKTAQGYPRQAQ
jgi:hypothetical protein